jgi:hypothetical protein
MKPRTLFNTVILVFLLVASFGCAPQKQFQRIGSSQDLVSVEKPVVALYGTPAINVNINVGGRNVGSWFGVIGTAIGSSNDKNRNQEALDKMLQNNIQPFTQQEIVSMVTSVLDHVGGPKIKESLLLPVQPEAAKTMKGTIPENEELFSADAFLSFYAAASPNAVSASFGAVEGVATKLEIQLNLMSPGPNRQPIWKDIYVCELKAVQDSLVANEAALAKKLIKSAIENLKPWIEKDLQGHDLSGLPYVSVQYRSGLQNEGRLLEDGDDYLSIRLKDGMTWVIPKCFVRDVKPIAVKGQ